MSRHRNLIYDDDMEDYYDDDYDDDGYYSNQAATTKKNVSASSKANKSTGNKSINQTGTSKITTNTNGKSPAIAIPSIPKAAKSSGGVSLPSKSTPAPPGLSTDSSSQLAVDLDALGFIQSLQSSSTTTQELESMILPNKDSSYNPQDSLSADVGEISDDDIDLNFNKDSSLPHLAIIVVGHVDSGKSTLVGHLLYKHGSIQQRVVHKYEKESKASGKGSFYLAWIMDESESEREHGVTINVAQRSFSTSTKEFTILDSPGHRDFMPNMISGCSSADVALLVVPATSGEFESCMMPHAQTREHAMILKSMGVNQVIVAVNKMDATLPAWSKERFEEIQQIVLQMLLELNFAKKAVRFVPLSGLSGENILSVSSPVADALSWYSGPTLMEAMDAFKVPPRLIDKSLRAVITSVISSDARSVEVGLTVLQGRLRMKRNVYMVTSDIVEVKDIKSTGVSSDELFAGEQGTVTLALRKGKPSLSSEIYAVKGMILCKGNPLLKAVKSFKATIATSSTLEIPIIPGSEFELYIHGEELQCRIAKIYSVNVNQIDGDIKRSFNPKCISKSRQATVKLVTEVPVCVEPFEVCQSLGRFAIRSRGKTCAVGIVVSSSTSTVNAR